MEPLGKIPEEEAEAAASFGEMMDGLNALPEVHIEYACEPRREGFRVWNAVREQFTQHPGDSIRTDLGELQITLHAPEGHAFSTFRVRYLPEIDRDPAVMSIRAAGYDGSALLEITYSAQQRIREVDLKQYGDSSKLCREGRAECIKKDFLEPIVEAIPERTTS